MFTGSCDHTARLWNVSTGKQVRSIGHEDEVESVAFSKDGQYLVTTCADTVVRIWDTATGELRRSSPKIGAIPLSAVFSPDGRYVLAGMNDNIAMLWDISSGGRVRFTGPQLSGTSAVFSPVAFSPDGREVLTGSWDGTARLWDGTALSGRTAQQISQVVAFTGQMLRSFEGHKSPITSVAFSPDGRYVPQEARTAQRGYGTPPPVYSCAYLRGTNISRVRDLFSGWSLCADRKFGSNGTDMGCRDRSTDSQLPGAYQRSTVYSCFAERAIHHYNGRRRGFVSNAMGRSNRRAHPNLRAPDRIQHYFFA